MSPIHFPKTQLQNRSTLDRRLRGAESSPLFLYSIFAYTKSKHGSYINSLVLRESQKVSITRDPDAQLLPGGRRFENTSQRRLPLATVDSLALQKEIDNIGKQ